MYLVIFFIAAGAGIGALWLYQHHQRKQLSVSDFRTSLERISTHSVSIPRKHIERRTDLARPAGRRRPEPLDPARREDREGSCSPSRPCSR